MIIGDVSGAEGPVLPRLTRDLTADARSGRLPPVRCRDAEIDRVVDVLLRQGKCNPALVGPAGVGKTAVAEGLAQRIAAGKVPFSLRGVRVLALDHVSLLAGTTYRGQYEERLRALVEETTTSGDVVLFIDELHNLIGQGTALGVAMDAGNMLKPALVRGDFRVVGATTDDEYDRWVRGDPALERRFQRVEVRELGSAETREILAARVPSLERHHLVAISEEAMDAAVELTDRHVHDRVRPDRAIDALDEAAAHTHARTTYTPATEALIARARAARRAPLRGETPRAPDAPRHEQGVADEGDTGFELLARQGFAVIERIGADIEAALDIGPGRSAADASPVARREPGRAADASDAERARRAELEATLRARLIAEGAVVRGHDVARVVSLMSGHPVDWP